MYNFEIYRCVLTQIVKMLLFCSKLFRILELLLYQVDFYIASIYVLRDILS